MKKIIIALAILLGAGALVAIKYGWGVKDQKIKNFNMMVESTEYDAGARAYVGACFFVGHDVNIDKKEAFKWFYKAAEMDLFEAELLIAQLYFLGEGVDKEKGAGLRVLFDAVKDREDLSLSDIGVKSIDLMEEINRTSIMKFLESEKSKGNKKAQRALSLLNEDLTEVNKTFEDIENDIRKALQNKTSWIKESYHRILLKN